MQRRAILEVSRRRGVDPSCPLRHTTPALAPLPNYVSRRPFRSSLVKPNSSDSSSPADKGESSPAPRPASSTPKFGNRWGGGQTQSQGGLSFAEKAARSSLLEKQAKEDLARKQKEQEEYAKKQENIRLTREREQRRKELIQRTRQSPRSGHNNWQDNGQPFRRDTQTNSRDARDLSRNLIKNGYQSLLPGARIERYLPRGLRPWECPECETSLWGTQLICPSCRAIQPGVHVDGCCQPDKGSKGTPLLPSSASSTEWICQGCGKTSPGYRLFCVQCNFLRPGVTVDAPPTRSSHSGNSWRSLRPPPAKSNKSTESRQAPDRLSKGRSQAGEASHSERPGQSDLNTMLMGLGQVVRADLNKSTGSHPDTDQISEGGLKTAETSRVPRQKPGPRDLEVGKDQDTPHRSRRWGWQAPRYERPELPESASQGLGREGANMHDAQWPQGETESQDSPDEIAYALREKQRQRGFYVDEDQESSPGDMGMYGDQSARDMKRNRDAKASKYRESRRQRKSSADEDFDAEEYQQRREERKRMKREKAMQKEANHGPSPLYLPAFISVTNLADVIGVRPGQFIRRMENMGFEEVTYDHILDAETAGLVATEFNFEPIFDTADEDLTAAPEPEDKSSLPHRPPVVTIMGHVDHGKTTILDWLRKSSVAASEHGGITQHIGAFSVAMPSGQTITFLDTPGHEAFLDMRRRGADVTDIVVLVVAADDSVKPQTVEAIKHATASRVPVIVAMSKIDKPGINIENIKQDLSVHGIHVEDYGGDVQAIGVSGKTGQGMLELEEAIVTLSEVLDHRADDTGNVEGWVIEASTKSHGRVATVLVRRGTLRPGDIIVAGSTWTRVRTLRNEAGVSLKEATPGTPVEIDGWREQPTAGTEILQAPDEQRAKDVVEIRLEKSETEKLGEDSSAMNKARRALLERRRQEQAGIKHDGAEDQSGPKKINFIIKADVGGSAEAVMNSVAAIGNNEVYANVLRSAVGPVSESDIEHAVSANGHLISFNMAVDPNMARMADKLGLQIMNHNVIYKLLDNVRELLTEQLAPLVSHRVTGEAEISQIFEINVKRKVKAAIAGCKVRNGVISTDKKVRVMRGQEVIYDGALASLKNVKKDVMEMRKDTECGMSFEDWTEFQPGDHVQSYEEIFEKRYL